MDAESGGEPDERSWTAQDGNIARTPQLVRPVSKGGGVRAHRVGCRGVPADFPCSIARRKALVDDPGLTEEESAQYDGGSESAGSGSYPATGEMMAQVDKWGEGERRGGRLLK